MNPSNLAQSRKTAYTIRHIHSDYSIALKVTSDARLGLKRTSQRNDTISFRLKYR